MSSTVSVLSTCTESSQWNTSCRGGSAAAAYVYAQFLGDGGRDLLEDAVAVDAVDGDGGEELPGRPSPFGCNQARAIRAFETHGVGA